MNSSFSNFPVDDAVTKHSDEIVIPKHLAELLIGISMPSIILANRFEKSCRLETEADMKCDVGHSINHLRTEFKEHPEEFEHAVIEEDVFDNPHIEGIEMINNRFSGVNLKECGDATNDNTTAGNNKSKNVPKSGIRGGKKRGRQRGETEDGPSTKRQKKKESPMSRAKFFSTCMRKNSQFFKEFPGMIEHLYSLLKDDKFAFKSRWSTKAKIDSMISLINSISNKSMKNTMDRCKGSKSLPKNVRKYIIKIYVHMVKKMETDRVQVERWRFYESRRSKKVGFKHV